MLQCRLEQRPVRRVAAHHAIHGHDIGCHDVCRHGDKVAVHDVEPLGEVAATSLRASRRQVGRCRLHGGHALGARGQELEAERADAGADVEHGSPVPGPENGIPQPAGGVIGAARPVALEIASGGGVTELTLVGGPEGGAAGAHGTP